MQIAAGSIAHPYIRKRKEVSVTKPEVPVVEEPKEDPTVEPKKEKLTSAIKELKK